MSFYFAWFGNGAKCKQNPNAWHFVTVSVNLHIEVVTLEYSSVVINLKDNVIV